MSPTSFLSAVDSSMSTPARAGAEDQQDEKSSEEDELSSGVSSLNISSSSSSSTPSRAPSSSLLPSFTVEAIADLMRSGRARRIIVLTGAGISVSCGIPDFRSPGTGLYDNLQRFNLPDPQAIFTLSYFRRHPEAFTALARELYPSLFTPSPTHHFITLLHRHGLLLRAYTQNIDGLEYLAELPADRLVQAHGGFHSSHCIDCDATVSAEENKADIMAGRLTHCSRCGGLVKPRIVFFGESLPPAFHSGLTQDFPQCDLLICMGTSLTVQPFASLIDRVGPDVPRLLINREAVGKGGDDEFDSDDEEAEAALLQQMTQQLRSRGIAPSAATLAALLQRIKAQQRSSGFLYHSAGNRRDVFLQGDCDSGVRRLAELLGWAEELEERVRSGYKGGGGLREGEGLEGKAAETVKEELREAQQQQEEQRSQRAKDGQQLQQQQKEEGVAREETADAADSTKAEAETAKL